MGSSGNKQGIARKQRLCLKSPPVLLLFKRTSVVVAIETIVDIFE